MKNTDKKTEVPQSLKTAVNVSAIDDLWKYVRENTEDFNFLSYRLLRNKIIPAREKIKGELVEAYLTGKRLANEKEYAPLASNDIAEKWFFDKYGY